MTLALIFHLLSLAIVAAGVLGGTLVHIWVLRAMRDDRNTATTIAALTTPFDLTASVGLILMVISGFGLMQARAWVDFVQPWLMIKLALYAVVLANQLFVARPSMMRLRALLGVGAGPADTSVVVKRLSVVHIVQLIGVAAIIAVGVWGPRQ